MSTSMHEAGCVGGNSIGDAAKPQRPKSSTLNLPGIVREPPRPPA